MLYWMLITLSGLPVKHFIALDHAILFRYWIQLHLSGLSLQIFDCFLGDLETVIHLIIQNIVINSQHFNIRPFG